jgi:hypothetical protein
LYPWKKKERKKLKFLIRAEKSDMAGFKKACPSGYEIFSMLAESNNQFSMA